MHNNTLFFPPCTLSLSTKTMSFLSSMKFRMKFNETPINFSFKLIFSETYAHYNSFIKNILLIYLFVHSEASICWSYFEKSQENSCGGFSFLIKLQAPLHLFSFEFCEIKNIYFVEKLRTAASEHQIYIFFFVLILHQNRYLPLNSDRLLGKENLLPPIW